MRLKLLLAFVVAAAVAAVALLVVRPWGDDAGYTGRRPIPDRAGLKDCGTFLREVNSGGITARGWSCFTKAMTGGGPPTRLRLTQFTTEGDPTYTTYTTEGGGIATVLTDSRLDRFAGRGTRVQTETCRRPEARPIARGLFRRCDPAKPVEDTRAVGSIEDVFCTFALHRHIVAAQLTTLAQLRAYDVGGPPPGLSGTNLFPSRPGAVHAAWCWTDEPPASASPGPSPTSALYGALATGESVLYFTDAAGPRPAGPISVR